MQGLDEPGKLNQQVTAHLRRPATLPSTACSTKRGAVETPALHPPPSMSPSKPSTAPGASDSEVQALLLRYRCPTPLHTVRTLLLGHIASPRLDVSPMAAVAQTFGGELPEFASSDEVEELMRVLVQGLWNQLSEHQSTRHPFRLPRFEVSPTRQALHDLALVRAQELNGFVDGLFGAEVKMLLPQKAHEAVVALAELHAMFDGAAGLLGDETKPAPVPELKALQRNLQQMTIVADEQINKAVQSCKRARGQSLETMATVMSRKFSAKESDDSEGHEVTERDDDQEPDFIESPLSQSVTRNGVTVRVDIYGDSKGGWILEIVDAENASHVWDEHFETDQLALTEALRALDEEPLEFLGRTADQPLN
jgi:hypothetical protein